MANHLGNAKQNHNEISPHMSDANHQKTNKQMFASVWKIGNPTILLMEYKSACHHGKEYRGFSKN